LGTNINYIFWSQDKLFLLRNFKELLTYDFKLANYSSPLYQGPIEPFYKITDFGDNYNVNYIDTALNSDLIYLISTDSSADKSSFYSFSISKKEYTKIFDTNANAFSFSPSGKYVILYNSFSNTNTIYETEKFTPKSEIEGDKISPWKIAWSQGEKSFYYFKIKNNYFNNMDVYENGKRIEYQGDYADLIKYDLESNQKNVILPGEKSNLASPINIETNLQNKLFFSTLQNNNVYSLDIK
jgi:hypothetical protein